MFAFESQRRDYLAKRKWIVKAVNLIEEKITLTTNDT